MPTNRQKDYMNKRIASLLISAVLIIIAVGALNNPAIVDACDNAVLLEKRHPGFYYNLYSNAIQKDFDVDGKIDTVIYPISKYLINQIPYDELEMFKKCNETSDDITEIIDFYDGTGILIENRLLTYATIDISTGEIIDRLDTVNDYGNCLALSTSKERFSKGINGLISTEIPFKNLSDITYYFYALRDPNYSFVISVMDDASHAWNWNKKLYSLFKNLKLEGNFLFRNSYIAVVSHGGVLVEEQSHDALHYQGLVDGITVDVTSAGMDAGNFSGIYLDDLDYSLHERGFNIVVIKDARVIDSVNIDTWAADNSVPLMR